MSGRGQVYSWVVVHRAVPLGFESRAPYAVVIVQLEDDPTVRFLGGVRKLGASSLEFGLAMEVDFVEERHGLVLPYWTPLASVVSENLTAGRYGDNRSVDARGGSPRGSSLQVVSKSDHAAWIPLI